MRIAKDLPKEPTRIDLDALRRASGERVLMYVNRGAGASSRRSQVEKVARSLELEGLRVQRVEDPKQLKEIASELTSRRELRCVVSVGGDGTFNLALNNTPKGAPLVVMPTGTENLLAGYLRHSRHREELIRVIREGVVVPLDAGDASGRLFGLMASVGFDAEVVRRVHHYRTAGGKTRNIRHLHYARPILESLGSYAHPRIRVVADSPDGRPLAPVEGSWLFAINVPRYASGLRIAPRADGADGLLDLCVFRRGDTAAGLWYLWHVLRRRHQELDSVEVLRTRRCRVESLGEPPAPCQIDGDFAGRAPLTISSAPGRMSVLVTRERAQRLLRYDQTTESDAACPPFPTPPISLDQPSLG